MADDAAVEDGAWQRGAVYELEGKVDLQGGQGARLLRAALSFWRDTHSMDYSIQSRASGALMRLVSIAKDFSPIPGGRTDDDGDWNGDKFRKKFLDEAVRKNEPLEIDLDGVAGLPGSFCDAAFGNVVRVYHLSRRQFEDLFKFKGTGPDFVFNKGMIYINVDRALSEDRPH